MSKSRENNVRNRRVHLWIFVSIIILFLAGLGYTKLFLIGWEATYEDVEVGYSKEANNIVCVTFEVKNSHILHIKEDRENVLVVREVLQSPWNKSLREKLEYGVTFVDENTIMDVDGHSHILTDEDKTIFEFKDKKIEMDWREIAKKVGLKIER